MALDWQGAVDAALEELPELRVDRAELSAYAASREGARPEHAADLILAWASARGDAAALRRLETLCAGDVAAAARKVDRSPAFLDELRQAVRVRLLVGAEGQPPRIAEYAGRGPLRAWVGVAALRLALNLRRAAAPAAAREEVLTELIGREQDPELRRLKTMYRAEFREALEEALAALSDRDRALLRLGYVDGLKLAQIARLYGVHESTASRWLAAAASNAGKETQRRLVARLSLSSSAVDSIGRMVLSNLDLSIARILR